MDVCRCIHTCKGALSSSPGTLLAVSGLQHNTCLQPCDLSSSSSSSSPLFSSLVSSLSSFCSSSPPRTAVQVHLAHETGDSHDIPLVPTEVIWPNQRSNLGSLTDPSLLVSSLDYHPANSPHIFPGFL